MVLDVGSTEGGEQVKWFLARNSFTYKTVRRSVVTVEKLILNVPFHRTFSVYLFP
jgi:hypothetical protein